MTAITSTASGLWSAGSTWVGGVAPGSGDTATIAGHTVTYDSGATGTVGDGTATACILLNNASSHLIVNANLILNGGGITLSGAGSVVDITPLSAPLTITLKSNGASVTPEFLYSGSTSTASKFNITGTSSNRVTVTTDTSVAGSVPGWMDTGGLHGQFNWSYATFSNLGSGTQTAFKNFRQCNLDHCLFTNCGAFFLSQTTDADNIIASHCDWRLPAGNSSVIFWEYATTAAKVSGTRSFSYCTWSGTSGQQVEMFADSVTCDHCVIDTCRWIMTAATGIHQRYTYCWRVGTSNGAGGNSLEYLNYNSDNTWTNCVWTTSASGGTNSHQEQENTANNGTTGNVWTNCAYDGWGTAQTGDFVSNAGPATVSNSLFINRGGNIMNGTGATTATETVNHCTSYNYTNTVTGAGYGVVVISETFHAATKLVSVQSNLFVNDFSGLTTGNTASYVRQSGGTVDYNDDWNMTGSETLYNPATSARSYIGRGASSLVAGNTTSSSDSTHVTIPSATGVQAGDSFLQGSHFAVITNVSGNILTLGANDTGGTGLTLTGGGGQAFTVYYGYFSDGRAYGSATFGSHDLTSDPRFLDPSRTASTWDTLLGGDGTYTHLRDQVLLIGAGYDSSGASGTYNSAYAIEDFLTYIRYGFTPQNPALRNTGHDSVDIGAQSWRVGRVALAGCGVG